MNISIKEAKSIQKGDKILVQDFPFERGKYNGRKIEVETIEIKGESADYPTIISIGFKPESNEELGGKNGLWWLKKDNIKEIYPKKVTFNF